MSQVLSYDSLLKCVSGLVVMAVAVVVVVETDLLPSQIRHPLRGAIHQTADRATHLPGVREILRAFH